MQRNKNTIVLAEIVANEKHRTYRPWCVFRQVCISILDYYSCLSFEQNEPFQGFFYSLNALFSRAGH